MLLRSASSPVLKSCPSSEAPIRSISASISFSFNSSSSHLPDPIKKISRTTSEHHLRDLSKAKIKSFPNGLSQIVVEKEEKREKVSIFEVSTICLESMVEGADEECPVLVDGGGGRVCGGGKGGRGGRDGSDGCSGSNHGFESTDQYYQEMIKANPNNALILRNYAKFLKEVRGDLEKAEEYCARAILANANDGEVLSMYGDLIWDVHKDADRAEDYFDRAVQVSPDDCYVLASYARFLWDAEDEEEEDQQEQHETNNTSGSSTSFFIGVDSIPPHPIHAS